MTSTLIRGTKGLGASGHSRPFRGVTDSWLTPEWIIDALGTSDGFDLDPCATEAQALYGTPWVCARTSWSSGGLERPWNSVAGLRPVWLNPPYGGATGLWLERLAEHGDGIALIFARTETKMFFEQVWAKANALLFIQDRLYFHYPDGRKAAGNSGAPSVLVAYGERCASRLLESPIQGARISTWTLR